MGRKRLAGTGSLEAAAQSGEQSGCVSGEVSRAGAGEVGSGAVPGQHVGVRSLYVLSGADYKALEKLDRAFRLKYSKKKALFPWVFVF